MVIAPGNKKMTENDEMIIVRWNAGSFCSLFAMVISCIETSSFLGLIRGGVIQRGGYVQGVSIPEGRGLNMSRGDRR